MSFKVMKKILVLLVIVFTAGCAVKRPETVPQTVDTALAVTPTSKPEEIQEIVKVTTSRLNMRAESNTKSLITGVLIKDEPLTVLSREGDWVKVQTDSGKQGWVAERYLTTVGKRSDIAKPVQRTPSSPVQVPEATPTPVIRKSSGSPASPNSLRVNLEGIWAAHAKAYRAGDLQAVKATTSSYSYAMMVNALSSAGRELTPDNMKSMAESLPDLSACRFVKILREGPTAGMVYIDKNGVDSTPNMPASVNFIFIKFVEEASGWKVDGIMNVGRPKYQKNGSATQFDLSDFPEDLAIDGKIHTAPEPISNPELYGVIDISSTGYRTEVTVNNSKQRIVEDVNSSGHIQGGLKKGKNRIEIVFTQIEGKDSTFEPSVRIRYLTAAKQEKEAFVFKPEKDIKGRHIFTFTIDD